MKLKLLLFILFAQTFTAQTDWNKVVLSYYLNKINIDFFKQNKRSVFTQSVFEETVFKPAPKYLGIHTSWHLSADGSILTQYYYGKKDKPDLKNPIICKQDSLGNLYPIYDGVVCPNNYIFKDGKVERCNLQNYFYNSKGQLIRETDTVVYMINKPFRVIDYFYSNDTLVQTRQRGHNSTWDPRAAYVKTRTFHFNRKGSLYSVTEWDSSSIDVKTEKYKITVSKGHRFVEIRTDNKEVGRKVVRLRLD
jgi:hypothetical protein